MSLRSRIRISAAIMAAGLVLAAAATASPPDSSWNLSTSYGHYGGMCQLNDQNLPKLCVGMIDNKQNAPSEIITIASGGYTLRLTPGGIAILMLNPS